MDTKHRDISFYIREKTARLLESDELKDKIVGTTELFIFENRNIINKEELLIGDEPLVEITIQRKE